MYDSYILVDVTTYQGWDVIVNALLALQRRVDLNTETIKAL